MKTFITIILILTASITAQAQQWRFEIEPMYFGCTGTSKYNDTADVLLVRATGTVLDSTMELYCELSNSHTGIAVRPGRNYYVPIPVLALLISTGKDIGAINNVLAVYDIVAIKEL